MKEILTKVNYNKTEKILLCGDFNVDSLKYQYKKPVSKHLIVNKNQSFASCYEDINNEYDYMISALTKNDIKIRDCYYENIK